MGKTKKTKKFALVKRRLNPKDDRLKKNENKSQIGGRKKIKKKSNVSNKFHQHCFSNITPS